MTGADRGFCQPLARAVFALCLFAGATAPAPARAGCHFLRSQDDSSGRLASGLSRLMATGAMAVPNRPAEAPLHCSGAFCKAGERAPSPARSAPPARPQAMQETAGLAEARGPSPYPAVEARPHAPTHVAFIPDRPPRR